MIDARLLADLRAAYDRDALRRSGAGLEWRSEVIDQWSAGLPDRARVLELGAGTGQAAAHMADAGYRVTAVDLSPENVERCRLLGLDARVGNFAELDLAGETFDGIFSINALIHVPRESLVPVVERIRVHLRLGGSFLMVVWGGIDHAGPIADDWCRPPRYFSFLTDEAVAALRFDGYEIASLDHLDNSGHDGLHSQVLVLTAT